MRYALSVALLLAGCATPQQYEWRHAQNDEAQFRKDKAQCEYEAVQASGSYAPNNRGYRTAFGQVIADNKDIQDRRMEIGIMCMKARGYVRAAIQ